MRRLLIIIPVALAVLVAWSLPVKSATTIARFSITSDAWQRGTVSQPGNQYEMGPIVYLGRSDDPERVYNGGFQAHTDLQPGEQVRGAFLEGFNEFGQSFSGVMYGTTKSEPFGSGCLVLQCARTRAVVPWRQGSIPMRAGYTPNLAPLVNELAQTSGFDGTITILIIGGSGSDNQSIDIRSVEHPLGPPPILQIER